MLAASLLSSYAEMKLEVLSMANGCGPISRKPAEGSREFWPLAWTEGRSASERFQDSSLGFFELKLEFCLELLDDIVVIQASSSSKSASNSWITLSRDSSRAFSRISCPYSPRNKVLDPVSHHCRQYRRGLASKALRKALYSHRRDCVVVG
jgi:hypothetical protein